MKKRYKLKLGELEDFYDDYEELIDDNLDYYDTEDQDGTVLSVRNYRIVIPEIESSFREGIWYKREDSPDSAPEDGEYEVQDDVIVVYEQDEKDINKYICCANCDIYMAVDSIAQKNNIPSDEIDDLDCYIEFDKKAQ